MTQHIAVIGAGPKGAALALLSRVLQAEGFPSPEVVLFDEAEAGSAWAGGGGFSDGRTLLCTSIMRDLGHPYANTFGPAVAASLFEEGSWASHLVRRGVYANWIARGMPQPTHAEYADYLVDVIRRSGVALHERTRVDAVAQGRAGLWDLKTAAGTFADFDGIVVTGSGPPKPALAGADTRVFNGRDFWLRLGEVEALLSGRDPSVVIIGCGGTAAAVALWLMSRSQDRWPVRIIGRRPTIVPRTDNVFENEFFGNDDLWNAITSDGREEFLGRFSSGSVWQQVASVIGASRRIAYTQGNARQCGDLRGSIAVLVEAENPPLAWHPASLVVDCSGFERWWFPDLFETASDKAALTACRAMPAPVDGAFIVAAGDTHARVHVPALGTAIGPAADNLMALSWVAARVLRPYLLDPTPAPPR